MQAEAETALWAWFLFRSGLPTARAKALLEEWLSRGLSLREALSLPRTQLNITAQEAARLRPPPDLPPVTALRWDNGYAPARDMGQGLLALPLKFRPALLFYRGEAALLSRPLVYLAPAPLDAEEQPALREALSLLADEPLLLGVYADSPQMAVLLEEMAYSSAEAVIFARTGLALYEPTDIETSLIEQERLVVVSPLPAQTAYQPAWDAVLQQVAVAAARRVLLTGEAARTGGTLPGQAAEPAPSTVLALTTAPPPSPALPDRQITDTPADVLPWVDTLFENASLDAVAYEQKEGESTEGHEGALPYWVGPELTEMIEAELGPPPSSDEILATLSKGGSVPEELRRRLAGDKKP
jgi:hypothetical protein